MMKNNKNQATLADNDEENKEKNKTSPHNC